MSDVRWYKNKVCVDMQLPRAFLILTCILRCVTSQEGQSSRGACLGLSGLVFIFIHPTGSKINKYNID